MVTWCFFGDEGWRALTREKSGRNLPSEHAPWNMFKIIEIYEENESDKEAFEAIKANGYYLFRQEA